MPSDRLSVAVFGASGYTGAETLRWCLGHPRLRVTNGTAIKAVGRRIDDLWPQFGGHTDLVLEEPRDFGTDVSFLCLPHGQAAQLAPRLQGTVIDLSGDHRVADPLVHRAAYGFDRETPAWVYGLPELGAERLRGVTRVANPGCFATALELALLPVAGELPSVVSAVGLTGSTGSGVTPTDTTHHPMRAENLRPYKVGNHQHVPEVVQALGGRFVLDFTPISAPIRRGILVTIPLPMGGLFERYAAFYRGNPLVRVLSRPPDLLHVLGSARADVGIVENAGRSTVFCAIDNLCRGAGSQAVANLNLTMGWAMELGLTTLGPVP